MNPTLHWTSRLEISASRSRPQIHSLRVTYDACEDAQFINYVHIPEQLRSALENSPACFHLETVALGSPASWLLPDGPMYVVLGVQGQDGTVHTSVPVEWKRYRRRKLTSAVLLAVAASGFALFAGVWTAAAVAGFAAASVFCWQRANSVRVKPFSVRAEVGRNAAESS